MNYMQRNAAFLISVLVSAVEKTQAEVSSGLGNPSLLTGADLNTELKGSHQSAWSD